MRCSVWKETEEWLRFIVIRAVLEVLNQSICVKVGRVESVRVFGFVRCPEQETLSVTEDKHEYVYKRANRNSHVNLLSLFRVNWATTDWEPLLHWLPAVVVAAPRQHSKSLLEATLPWSLGGTETKMPLKI
jgi:hypothetical protein